MIKTLSRWLAAIALALPLASNAGVQQFNASLSASGELAPSSFNALASGVATLFYDTVAHTYSLSLSAFGLSGPVTGAHIHAQASTIQNGPVRVALDSTPFAMFNNAGTLLIGGANVASPGVIAAGNGYLAQSFLSVLQSGLAYINVHTAANPGGEIRGQLFQVAFVPELEVYAMMFAGLGLIGVIAARRRQRN
jgi:hypothetical protein